MMMTMMMMMMMMMTTTMITTMMIMTMIILSNPRLISPCIDVPLASVQMERTDSLELVPIKKSPTHATIVGTVNTAGDTRTGYYSTMSSNTDGQGYYKPDSVQEARDPLLSVGSYVQPGYIYVGDNCNYA